MFTLDNYTDILQHAKQQGYCFYTVNEFLTAGCPRRGACVLRHDLDKAPETLLPMLECEAQIGAKSSVYFRAAANEYNLFSYRLVKIIKWLQSNKFEIGLHTNFFEFARINDMDPIEVLRAETAILNSLTQDKIKGLATHRDINYIHNSLPYLNDHWQRISTDLGYDYHAYDMRLFEDISYINEGLNPHLCWRTAHPKIVLETGQSMYMLTHSHWWYKIHPFEHMP